MSIPIFPAFIPQPARERVKIVTSVREVNLGDEYTQASARGINTEWHEFELEWSDLSATQNDTIVAFLTPKLRRTPFNWTDHRGTTYKIKCMDMDYEPLTSDLYNMKISCKEDFTV